MLANVALETIWSNELQMILLNIMYIQNGTTLSEHDNGLIDETCFKMKLAVHIMS